MYKKDQEAVFKGAPIIFKGSLDEFMDLLDYDPADEMDELLEQRSKILVQKSKEIDDEYERVLVEMKTIADKNVPKVMMGNDDSVDKELERAIATIRKLDRVKVGLEPNFEWPTPALIRAMTIR